MAQVHRIGVEGSFDPAVSDREFQIACADCISTSLLAQVIAKIIDAGPRIRNKLRLIDPAYGRWKKVNSTWRSTITRIGGDNLRIGGLYSDDVVCLMRTDHPLLKGAISLAQYLAMAHLAPHPNSRRDLDVNDSELAKIGYKRRVAGTVPEFNMASYVLTRIIHDRSALCRTLCSTSAFAVRARVGGISADEILPALA
jgi:DNA-binding transcriptional LysR family regulator